MHIPLSADMHTIRYVRWHRWRKRKDWRHLHWLNMHRRCREPVMSSISRICISYRVKCTAWDCSWVWNWILWMKRERLTFRRAHFVRWILQLQVFMDLVIKASGRKRQSRRHTLRQWRIRWFTLLDIRMTEDIRWIMNSWPKKQKRQEPFWR